MPAPVRIPEPVPVANPSPVEELVEREPEVKLPQAVFETAEPIAIQAAAPADLPAQTAVVEALASAGLTTASDAMADAVWNLADGEATIQTELSKTMLGVVINAEAEKVVRAALRTAGILRMTLLPGAAQPAAAKKARTAKSGSAQAKAQEHPMVQQAQRLFGAEIQSVIDLSGND